MTDETTEGLEEQLADARKEKTEKREKKKPHADKLIELADAASLFNSPDGTGFADIVVDNGADGTHRETWPIRRKGFRKWLARQFYAATGGAPSSEALQSALNVIEAKAQFDSPEREVYIRIAGAGGKIYIDLADAKWQAIEVDAKGWRIIADPPVRFRRAAGMLPLPAPATGGSINDLRRFINVRSGVDFVLIIAWLLAALRDRGPYPVLALSGEQGTAKSTLCTLLRALIDPNTAPLRALPREDRDLFIAACNGHCIAFDNVSDLRPWISDTLCRISSGGGFATRTLFTDQDETLFSGSRPILLNGITEVVERPDLADRTIFISLGVIPEDKRKLESDLIAAFKEKRAGILGALLDTVVAGLRALPTIRLDGFPRMADFALWASACETVLWEGGTFIGAYTANIRAAVAAMIDANRVAAMVLQLVNEEKPHWEGKASDLLAKLSALVGETAAKAKDWPQSPQALSGALSRVAPLLRASGVRIEHTERGARIRNARSIVIDWVAESSARSAQAPAFWPKTAKIFSAEVCAEVRRKNSAQSLARPNQLKAHGSERVSADVQTVPNFSPPVLNGTNDAEDFGDSDASRASDDAYPELPTCLRRRK